MKATGIDISDHSVELAELRQRFGATSLRCFCRTVLPAGIVQDGIIEKTAELARLIRECYAQQEQKQAKLSSAFFAVPESKVFTHVFSFPRDLNKNAVREAIDVQFSEYFPFDIEQTAFDWKVVQETDQTQMVMVAACDRRYVEQLLALADELNMKVAGVDIESVSTARAVLPPPKDLDAYMLVDLGANVSSMSIFGEQGMESTFALDIGGKKLCRRIANRKQIPLKEATRKMHALNFNNRKGNKEVNELAEIVERMYTPVVEEVRRMKRFFEESRKKQIRKIYLCGGVALTKGLAGYFQSSIGCSVKTADPMQHIKNAGALAREKEALLYANVIGLALGGVDRKYHATRFNFLSNLE